MLRLAGKYAREGRGSCAGGVNMLSSGSQLVPGKPDTAGCLNGLFNTHENLPRNKGRVMEFFASKCDGVLVGVSEDDQEKIAGLGLDTVIKCTSNKNRNYKNLQRFMVFIKTAFDMQEIYTDKDEFRGVITVQAGYYTIVLKDDNITILMPKSIAFDKMEEEEFKIVFKKCIDSYLKWRETNKLYALTADEFMQIINFS
jgi:hypothetical protein